MPRFMHAMARAWLLLALVLASFVFSFAIAHRFNLETHKPRVMTAMVGKRTLGAASMSPQLLVDELSDRTRGVLIVAEGYVPAIRKQ